MAQNVILRSSDGKDFIISEEAAKQSGLVESLMKDRENADEPVPILKVEGAVLEKVIQWLLFHNEHPLMYPDFVIGDRDKNADLHPWDVKFCDDLEKDMLFEMLKAATFMNIDMLVEATAKTIAKNLIGKTVEQMREYLNEENDYTPEEIEELKKKYAD
ncbi:glycoprotein FP21 precursor, putative [Entamoeba dispar SAW760]|uniref:Glycoprotein FP21, putative n=1 Tax=Entamoeba dispar (strain ATCC PRA-260 / SAW760) TaxID=370354 RepID=B0EGI8_ENTDS|nr:glycoprotein FP21 precursor, putative [Entamoeba dispar SAW760]EDR26367.1 glycoprotein FP21 precursor, putative [Entamoeba dispar SAW760]|eukprot:EDR26367.1 glycoprotein FP21 precursor, putative [Entamoeba dispar SAW760]